MSGRYRRPGLISTVAEGRPRERDWSGAAGAHLPSRFPTPDRPALIIDPDSMILGCHIIGPEASNLIEEVVVAMKAGSGTVWDIRDSVHIHPALSEVVDRAFSGRFEHSRHHQHQHQHQH